MSEESFRYCPHSEASAGSACGSARRGHSRRMRRHGMLAPLLGRGRVFAVLCVLGALPAPAEPIVIRSKRFQDAKRGKGFTRIRSDVQFRGAVFDYRALVRDSVPDQCVAEKYGDFMFGLSFGRRGNGGWNIWRFLRPIVELNGKSRDALLAMPMQGVYVLQQEPKAALEFVWHVSPTQERERFLLRAVRQPAVEHWLFLRLELQGTATWDHVEFSCYPGNTSGPPTRQRWVAGRDRDHNLHEGATAFAPDEAGIVLYNQCNQQCDGCLIVWLPEEQSKVGVKGTYGVGINFTPVPAVKTLHVALGYFRNTPAEEAIRHFRLEGRDRMVQHLRRLDWDCPVDEAVHRAFFTDTVALLDQEKLWNTLGDVSLAQKDRQQLQIHRARFDQLRHAYDRAGARNDLSGIVAAVTELKQLREELFKMANSQLLKP